MSIRQPRLEWISLVYLAFFVLAVFSPSIFTHDMFGVAEKTLEELTIFLFGLAGIATFTVYERIMENREKEREQERLDYHRAKQELIDSYAYIGSINRKIELLKTLANDTSLQAGGKKLSKDLFQALLAHACAACGAQSALLRFVDLEHLRTDKEYFHPNTKGTMTFKIPNRDLAGLRERGHLHVQMRTDDGREILVIPSDHVSPHPKAHLMLSFEGQNGIAEVDPSLLKVFVNQAEMLYRNFIIEKPTGEVTHVQPLLDREPEVEVHNG